jgi:predicted lipoprotein with Yx(FWY)xxD motif
VSVWSSGRGRLPAVVACTVLATAGTLAAGCGGGTSGSGGTASGGASPVLGGSSGPATVTTATSKLGTILVDGGGRTLYLFEKDRPNQSACVGACVAVWPVARSGGSPKAGGAVQASMLGTTRRNDNTMQVTYNRHPLYYYSGDTKAGQLNGQNLDNFGAEWYVVGPTGGKVEGAGS